MYTSYCQNSLCCDFRAAAATAAAAAAAVVAAAVVAAAVVDAAVVAAAVVAAAVVAAAVVAAAVVAAAAVAAAVVAAAAVCCCWWRWRCCWWRRWWGVAQRRGGARAGLRGARAGPRSASANKPWFSAMLGANPACWSDTIFCGVPIVFCIWHVQFPWRKWWHLLSVRTVSCKSNMLKWYHVLRCAQCVLHLTCTVSVTKVMASTQCAHCFVQIQHVEVIPCSAVCPLYFAFDMCGFGGKSDDIYSVWALFRANPICWAGAVSGGVPMVFCSSWVDFTQVGRLHAECLCPCGGLTSRGLGWLNLGAKYVWFFIHTWADVTYLAVRASWAHVPKVELLQVQEIWSFVQNGFVGYIWVYEVYDMTQEDQVISTRFEFTYMGIRKKMGFTIIISSVHIWIEWTKMLSDW